MSKKKYQQKDHEPENESEGGYRQYLVHPLFPDREFLLFFYLNAFHVPQVFFGYARPLMRPESSAADILSLCTV